MDPSALAAKLKAASDAYYNGGPVLMDDATFDTLVEQLATIAPDHPFLATVGAPPPPTTGVPLPVLMPSLDKIKPGMPQLDRFLARPGPFVVSEKLDGLSALWSPKTRALYLRGDGRIGQPVSHLAGLGLQGLVGARFHAWLIRGELILPRSVNSARAVVNGLVHRDAPDPDEVAKLRFVAYEVIQPSGMTRSEQFAWLQQKGFLTPWWERRATLTESDCKTLFTERRAASLYETDGIVVGMDAYSVFAVPTTGPVKPPKDCVAFKMPLAEQSATTTVREVLWAPSAQGYLIPRIRFDPVQIGSAQIEFCTGHNARTVVAGALGPGATIRIRRSGDVIPTLDAVLAPAPGGAALPVAGTYEWAGNPDIAVHMRATGQTPEQAAARLQHFAKVLDIPNMGPATCKTLVEAGIMTVGALLKTADDRLATLLGPKSGPALAKAVMARLTAQTSEIPLMLASSLMPRGVGESKLAALAAAHPDCMTWGNASISPPAGWTEAPFREFQTALTSYVTWRRTDLSVLPFPRVATATAPQVPKTGPLICMTGFRDKELEAAATARGMSVAATFTSKVAVLIKPDGAAPETEKVKKARASGTEVLTRSEFTAKYLSPQ